MKLGPENATLTVKTGKTGVAAKAGHNLVIEVGSWQATLDDDAVQLTADGHSFRVIEGTGGAKPLGDEEKAAILQSIREEVLEDPVIEFRSTRVENGAVEGDLTLAGATRPIAFELDAGDNGSLKAHAVVKQTDWGMKPYSALFGTLKVADEVEVVFEAKGDASG